MQFDDDMHETPSIALVAAAIEGESIMETPATAIKSTRCLTLISILSFIAVPAGSRN